MNKKLLDYYNRELTYLREMGAEFARQHPKIAGRLGMNGIDVADPYVERLMEGFAFLTSRVQLKMDAEFPRFTQRLLEIIYPNFISPTPSMAIAKFEPDIRKGDVSSGFLIPRGTIIESDLLKRNGLSCHYSTAHPVTLQPVELSDVELGGIPADLPLVSLGFDPRQCKSTLRIRLKFFSNTASKEVNVDHLAFHLSGPDIQAQQLLELLMQHSNGVICQTVGKDAETIVMSEDAIRHDGFSDDESILPNDLRNFDGYRLLQEYFAFPARFLFFSIHGLERLFKKTSNKEKLPDEFEIIILFDKLNADLARFVNVEHLSLNCTPVVNLFPKWAERIILNDKNHEYHLVMDRVRPLDFEVFSVQRLIGVSSERTNEQEFRPFYSTQSVDHSNYGAYFAIRREQRVFSEHAKIYGPRTDYIGSEVFVSLVDEQQSPWNGDLKYISAEALCTNRDLPLMLIGHDNSDFLISDSIPVRQIRLIRGPTKPRPGLADGWKAWGLISHLQMNYLSLMETGPEGVDALRQLLGLYSNLAEPAIAKQIHGIRHCQMKPIYRRSTDPGPMVFSRGIGIDLTVDEQAFSGTSPYILGCVLERLFARMVSLNSFTEMRLVSQQRGHVAKWQPRTGKKALL